MGDLFRCSSLEEGIRQVFGEGVSITGNRAVTGGDINEAMCLTLSNGERVFVKCNRLKGEDFFRAEAIGLGAIRATNTIKTPLVYCYGFDENRNYSFLMMDMVIASTKIKDYYIQLGVELAALHKAKTEEFVTDGIYGFVEDNFIGSTRQINAGCDSWIDFFRSFRLEPQLRMATRHYAKEFDKRLMRKVNSLLDRLPDILIEPEFPSLVHGDLWAGNHIVGSNGKAWLIDPAAYVGHSEVDIAMTELFGRFPEEFYRAYNSMNHLESGYSDRRNIYNLYQILNHVNLFGTSYIPSAVDIIEHYGRD
ncbi:MAG: fructosamine kinase family protein [Lachnospiraceae bacterium]|nr:fructosamine kinase family protein [Lachnospiraceae bacterium]